MKKLLFAIAIIFSVNCKAQDTTFYQKRNDLYMQIRSKVIDSTIYKQQYSLKVKKRKRNDRIITIVVGTIFSGISVWFWSGYSRYSN
jgi:cell division protein FtsL